MTKIHSLLNPALIDLQPTVPSDDAGRLQLIRAHNDVEAVYRFLKMVPGSPATRRNYSRECERLLLWLRHERGHDPQRDRVLPGLMLDDYVEYFDFLRVPPRHWCGRKTRRYDKNGRRNPKWRPFEGPLAEKPAALRFAKDALQSLLDWLEKARYVPANPLRLHKLTDIADTKQTEDVRRAIRRDKALSVAEMELVSQALETYRRNTPKEIAEYERTRFLLRLFYHTTMRISEIASVRMGDICRGENPDGSRYFYMLVTGKGAKTRQVDLPDAAIADIKRYRVFRELAPFPTPGERAPFAMHLKSYRSLGEVRIREILKTLFCTAARMFADSHPELAQRLAAKSTHALRHTSISRQVDLNVPRDVRKNQAGHSKDDTAAIYEHRDDGTRHRELNRLDWDRNIRELLHARKAVAPTGREHTLEVGLEEFDAASHGVRPFVVCRNEHAYQAGDVVVLRDAAAAPAGRQARFMITRIEAPEGIKEGYCVMAIRSAP